MNDYSGIALSGQLPDGAPCAVVVDTQTRVRLANTCFRGGQALAGNFAQWRSAEDVLNADGVREALLADILRKVEEDEVRKKNEFGTHHLTIALAREIGWSSTAPPRYLEKEFEAYWSGLSPGWRPGHPVGAEERRHLEVFRPNEGSKAMRFRPSARVYAPSTKLLTLVYSIYFRPGRWLARVRTMYPGPDIGRLQGDITREQGVIFFDWQNPGQSLERPHQKPQPRSRH